MQLAAADCQRSESSIAIFTAESTDYSSYAAFYTRANARLLRDWWHVAPNNDDEYAMAHPLTRITPGQLQRAAESFLKATPIAGYRFSRPEISEAFNIRNEWNFREYGWIGLTEFGLLAWETSA